VRIWLHDYGKWSEADSRFANSIHDHRYGFVSVILAGGYTEHRWSMNVELLEKRDSRKYTAGDILMIDSMTIHSLEAVQRATATLVVQLPKDKDYSNIYDRRSDGTFTERRQYDLAHKFSRVGDERDSR
jgi:hypothetical protein